MKKLLLPICALTAINSYANPIVATVKETPVAIEISASSKSVEQPKETPNNAPQEIKVTNTKTTIKPEAKNIASNVPSVTTNKGQIEVKTETKSVAVSKAVDAPQATTITKTTQSIESKTTPKQTVIYQIEEPEQQLSQADLDYINAVNVSEKINTIESKIINNKAISKEELKILRQHNPNY